MTRTSPAEPDADALRVVDAPWWERAVFYQIYPRSFADSNRDGVGDLPGIRSHLPDLAWLGVDALWLSPFYPSPMADFGYDVSDYCGVDPLFGTIDDFDGLLADAHELGMKVIIDWVPNHSSDRHPWFVDARSSRSSAHRNWYFWRDRSPDGKPPNNWVSAFDLSAPTWTLDESTDQWYLHLFEPGQPDLNWSEPEVVAAMHDVLRFWLDRGVDGFRADAVTCIGKDPALADDPKDRVGIPHCIFIDEPVTHQYLRSIRKLVDSYGDRLMLGEVFFFSTEAVAPYYGSGDELHLCFNFPPLFAAWKSSAWSECLRKTFRALDPRHAWPTWVLSNHDNPRARTRYDFGAALGGESEEERARRSEARARAAAVLLLTLRGTPFVYQGEELGLLDAVVPEDRVVDPGGRDGCRAPLPWDDSDDHGWPTDDPTGPWLPFPPDPATRNYATLRRDPSSILHLYRRLLAVRRKTPALVAGEQTTLELPDALLGYRRTMGGSRCTVLINFTGQPVEIGEKDGFAASVGSKIAVSSDGAGQGEGEPFTGRLAADQAVVIVE